MTGVFSQIQTQSTPWFDINDNTIQQMIPLCLLSLSEYSGEVFVEQIVDKLCVFANEIYITEDPS